MCGVAKLAGAVPQADELMGKLKLHLPDHFSSIKSLKESLVPGKHTRPRVQGSTVPNVHVRASHTHGAVLATGLLCCWECFC